MIKLLVLSILLIQTTLFSNETNTTQISDQEIFRSALLDFKSLRYQEAYNKFDKLFYNHLGNQNINFYLGRSAFEIHKYELSMSAYERILMNDPENIRTRLELARVYFMMKMYESSEVEFLEIIKDGTIPKEVKDKINYYLYLIENSRKKSYFTSLVSTGVGHDSNTNNGSDGNLEPIEDNFHQALASVTHIYDFAKKDGFILKNNLMVLEKSYFNETDKNIMFFNYSPTISYKAESSTFDLSVGSDYLIYGQNPYVYSYYFSPKYTTINEGGWISSYYYKQRFNRYVKGENQIRNSTVYEGAYSESKSFKTATMLSYQFLAQYEMAESSEAKNIDVNRAVGGANILLMQSFAFDISLKLQTQVRATYYPYKNLAGTNRKDLYTNYISTLSYKFNSTMFIDLQYNYSANYSNQDVYNYTKQIIMSNFTYTF